MRTRPTSAMAYHRIKDEGLLSQRRWEVYDIVYRFGPMTANEAYEKLAEEKGRRLRFDSNTRARFTELREQGVLQELGSRPCRITTHTCILWEVTEDLPRSLPKRPRREKCCRCHGSGTEPEGDATLFPMRSA